MTRKSKYTNNYKKSHGKNPIPFPHIVLEEKKEVYFRIVSGFPAILAVKPIMREHFSDEYKGLIASDEIWEDLMKDIPPHFIIEKDKTVVFLIKGIFKEELILSKYMDNFPKSYKGTVMRCEESFYKLRMKANSIK
tara:strand:+ start:742 stop:1149 length:408 start_codon:yes stop_codon:yes gene_type:complete